jgi:glycosyltransferase involved in cell wall biosynthesis
MKILYSAIDQTVPGPLGGAVHVEAVARGLAARGHDVHVLAMEGAGGFPTNGATWHPLGPPFGRRRLRLLRSARVTELARRLAPDVVMERYYNFGGEAVRAAQALGALTVLEVNAPIIDFPGSAKHAIDRALIVEPMRRWRDWQCRAADLIVTPSARIVPPWVPRERILRIEWGADVDRFRPDVPGATPYSRRPGRLVAIFAGAFRRWHGAIQLVEAIRDLRQRGRGGVDAVLMGGGPELDRVKAAAAGIDGVTITGAVPHALMPAALAGADVGVAPFDVSAHPPLAIDFFWSPLKVFEYMASGLPVVAPRIPRLAEIIRDGREGLLYDAARPKALGAALDRLTDPSLRERLGQAARERVVSEYSWARHTAKLDEALRASLAARRR